MADRTAIIDTVTSLFWSSDHNDWARLTAVFADSVRLDYTALQGGEPADLAPADIVAGWRPLFEALDARQHLVANHLVTITGDTAVVTAAFQATHQWRGQTWTLGGDYRFHLTRRAGRWAIDAMTMTPSWETGNPELASAALAAARDEQGR
ncbi:conserved hypothetical protein [Xylanimonas cellulosilytica DSM 15894]|uniref:SnoaL-like domain-containing protein n=1 Tax=Xylanimonas cellulosilytica (strain DSM 15894 / JCM 12276 / CECT 5975 / KCTC 9989 / LMG 20990 / NBRC 107835 / XIL07) TaxID=446471 RepID=D1BZ28_XYLCX|nr:nuclear transport factor 2 family protein [Xylanimonas cellulosilytica]ACZ31925.1 conserved hypothetical protein [Xylanimonas cellulosilytica DSM 15894]